MIAESSIGWDDLHMHTGVHWLAVGSDIRPRLLHAGNPSVEIRAVNDSDPPCSHGWRATCAHAQHEGRRAPPFCCWHLLPYNPNHQGQHHRASSSTSYREGAFLGFHYRLFLQLSCVFFRMLFLPCDAAVCVKKHRTH